jgi:hypothetical protein
MKFSQAISFVDEDNSKKKEMELIKNENNDNNEA